VRVRSWGLTGSKVAVAGGPFSVHMTHQPSRAPLRIAVQQIRGRVIWNAATTSTKLRRPAIGITDRAEGGADLRAQCFGGHMILRRAGAALGTGLPRSNMASSELLVNGLRLVTMS
jgi:hypothetical protein